MPSDGIMVWRARLRILFATCIGTFGAGHADQIHCGRPDCWRSDFCTLRFKIARPLGDEIQNRGGKMKLAIALSSALLITGFVAATTEQASAVVYCTYIGYPTGCVVKPGVVLKPRPVARAAAREAVRPGVPMNRGGPVNRPGRF